MWRPSAVGPNGKLGAVAAAKGNKLATKPPRLKVERTFVPMTPLRRRALRLAERLKAVEDKKMTMQRALSLRPEDVLYFCTLAKEAIADKDFEGGLACARVAVACDEQSYLANLTLGQCLALAKQSDPAIVALRRAAELRPEELSAHVSLGELYLGQLNYSAAADEFQLVMALDPKAETPQGARAQALVARVLLTLG